MRFFSPKHAPQIHDGTSTGTTSQYSEYTVLIIEGPTAMSGRDEEEEAEKGQKSPSNDAEGDATKTATSRHSVTKPTCQVCYGELNKNRPRGIVPCDHNEICGLCHLRLRYLHNDTKCPICKTSNEHVVVDTRQTKNNKCCFADYPVWGNDLGDQFVFEETSGMFFEKPYYESSIQNLFAYTCTCRGCDFVGDALRPLQDHLRKTHRLTLCHLCLEHKRDFCAKLPRFNPSGLTKHMGQQHQTCQFCKETFYDIQLLYSHLDRQHYKCHVCGDENLKYFDNYSTLEQHFDRKHFLCTDPMCRAARFVVFDNELDYRAHRRDVHGENNNTKLQIAFRVGRHVDDIDQNNNNSGDPESFTPPRLHPQHVQRTEELRARAAELRQQQQQEGELDTEQSFPSLNNNTNNNNDEGEARVKVGWTSDETRQRLTTNSVVTAEAFPALPTAVPSNAQRLRPNQKQPKLQAARDWKQTASKRSNVASLVSSTHNLKLQKSQFPALGGGSLTGTQYKSAQTYAQQQRPPNASSFPPLQATSRAPTAARAPTASYSQTVPSFQSPNTFPSLPTASRPTQRYTAAEALGKSRKPPPSSSWTSSNPPAMTTTASLDDLKMVLGNSKYKTLKKLTREFANRELTAVNYIDLSKSLFVEDDAFWKFMPQLIDSTPSQYKSQAHQYLQEMQQQAQALHSGAKTSSKPKSSQRKELQQLAFGSR